MDRILDIWVLSKLNHEAINNLAWNKVESVIKVFPAKKNLGPDGLTAEIQALHPEQNPGTPSRFLTLGSGSQIFEPSPASSGNIIRDLDLKWRQGLIPILIDGICEFWVAAQSTMPHNVILLSLQIAWYVFFFPLSCSTKLICSVVQILPDFSQQSCFSTEN